MSSITTQPAIADADDAIQPRQKRAALTVAMLGFAVVALDAQVTNVALSAIRQHLGGGLSGLQWVVTGYTLMFSALLLFGGSVANRVGSKNAYRAGMALFVLASLVCGLAPNLPVLIAARLVQGAGAALVTPTSLSLVREAFEDARERARAIALWAVGGSVAAAAGPLLGGVLVQDSWRLIGSPGPVQVPAGRGHPGGRVHHAGHPARRCLRRLAELHGPPRRSVVLRLADRPRAAPHQHPLTTLSKTD